MTYWFVRYRNVSNDIFLVGAALICSFQIFGPNIWRWDVLDFFSHFLIYFALGAKIADTSFLTNLRKINWIWLSCLAAGGYVLIALIALIPPTVEINVFWPLIVKPLLATVGIISTITLSMLIVNSTICSSMRILGVYSLEIYVGHTIFASGCANSDAEGFRVYWVGSASRCGNRDRNFYPRSSGDMGTKSRASLSFYMEPIPAEHRDFGNRTPYGLRAARNIQPALPMTKGRGGTVTLRLQTSSNDNLLRAMNPRRKRIGRNMQRHRPQEFIRFLYGNRARSSRRQDPTNISSPLRAFAPSTMDYPLHATNVDVDVVAKCRRGLLRHPQHKSAASSEAVSGSVANIHGGINRLLDDHSAAQAFRIGGRRVRPNEPKLGHGLILRDGWDVRPNHRRRPTLAASVGFESTLYPRFESCRRKFSCLRSRACPQLSQARAQTKCKPARKFRAVFVAGCDGSECLMILKKRSMRLRSA